MTGPGSKEDVAFTTSGIAYKTGKPWRKQFQVIRVRESQPMSSKIAKQTLDHLDLSISKLELSDEELNYDKSQPSLMYG
jgi:hypothetical protein